jgi:hypothetical protein
MTLLLVVILHPRRFLSTTLATKSTTNQTATGLTPIAFHLWFIPQSNMMVAFSFPFTEMKLPRLVNLFLRVLGWLKFTRRPAAPFRVLSWIFDDGTSSSIPAAEMPNLIPKPSVDVSDNTHLLPPFLKVGLKITFDKDGQYHKGFLSCLPNGSYQFSYKSHINKKHEDWGIPLPDLATWWQDLCAEGLLLPGHGWSSFDCSASANHVSARGLIRECLHSLLSALDPNHPDREVWLESFCEEKRGIKSLNTYDKILLAEYRALREKGAPRAIPTMCVLTIKKDEMMNPHRAKSCIVVLGNHEDRVWTKPEKYAPVLRPDSLRLMVSMATERHTVLKQGDCKNAFCQGVLPDNEVMIVKPPIGNPDTKKDEYWLLKRTLYGLCRSPQHWYTKINAA